MNSIDGVDYFTTVVEVVTVEKVIDAKTREVLYEGQTGESAYTLMDVFEDGEISGGYDYVETLEEAEEMKKELKKELKGEK